MQLKIYAGILALGAVAFGISEGDKSMNYIETPAKIVSVKKDCFIKKRRSKIVDKNTGDLAYMDCAIAPAVAKQHGYSESHISERAKVVFRYRSPVDQKYYKGEFERDYATDELKRGATIKIHAHKEEPSKTRT